MFALGLRYLNGFVAAARPDDRDRPEWPPHPGRVFMALAAAHFGSGGDPEERQALLWVEGLEASAEPMTPVIVAGGCAERAAVTHFVPVNDSAGPSKASLQSAALTRERQPRTFARAWLEDETAYLVWPQAEPDVATRKALDGLCAKVTRLGHSSSLVHMWLADEPQFGAPTWEPVNERAEIYLRIALPGTLEYLEQRFNAEEVERYCDLKLAEIDEANPKARKAIRKSLKTEFPSDAPAHLRPQLSVHQGYARPVANDEATAAGPRFSPHLQIKRLSTTESPYRSLDLCAILQVTQRWRDAALARSDGLSVEARCLLSGHDTSGAPLEVPHLAFVPMAFVGSEHADGHLQGVGLAFPDEISLEARRDLVQAFGEVRELKLGRLGVWKLELVSESIPPINLRAVTWTAHPDGAERWATVTPIAFDRHPKAPEKADYGVEASEMVRRSCLRVGLPEPREIILTPVSAHLGAPPSHEFPRMRRKDGSMRCHAHAILVFDEPVRGPLLLGAGRYRGYGFCRPLA